MRTRARAACRRMGALAAASEADCSPAVRPSLSRMILRQRQERRGWACFQTLLLSGVRCKVKEPACSTQAGPAVLPCHPAGRLVARGLAPRLQFCLHGLLAFGVQEASQSSQRRRASQAARDRVSWRGRASSCRYGRAVHVRPCAYAYVHMGRGMPPHLRKASLASLLLCSLRAIGSSRRTCCQPPRSSPVPGPSPPPGPCCASAAVGLGALRRRCSSTAAAYASICACSCTSRCRSMACMRLQWRHAGQVRLSATDMRRRRRAR